MKTTVFILFIISLILFIFCLVSDNQKGYIAFGFIMILTHSNFIDVKNNYEN